MPDLKRKKKKLGIFLYLAVLPASPSIPSCPERVTLCDEGLGADAGAACGQPPLSGLLAPAPGHHLQVRPWGPSVSIDPRQTGGHGRQCPSRCPLSSKAAALVLRRQPEAPAALAWGL